ncbi:spermidine synthase [Paludisphaera rhizosphaerae]|uniref:spermidine synthase n=1 Tax=Paludisphaera rhizosphaerae TaxID=2711216 RepID=UPI0013EBDD82|nr:fused MFS/spermidine synthase [Paludisphaera rhizosphaerae]
MSLVRILRKAPPWATTASAFILALVAATCVPPGLVQGALFQSPIIWELDEVSKFSHLKVSRTGNTRTLWFVRDNGEEVIESKIDLSRRADLLIEYTRFMFLSYVFNPQPKRSLIVGLGGGAMVHFLQAKEPELKVDVVEIDPSIVSVADRFFDVRSKGNVDIKLADGLTYLKNADAKYDVIYMDAFLRPSAGTDRVGVPSHLKTEQFYDQIVRSRLNPDGVVVFNLNPHLSVLEDIRTIKSVFPNTYVFKLTGYEGYVVVASTAQKTWDSIAISAEATRLDHRFKAPFKFRDMAGRLVRR